MSNVESHSQFRAGSRAVTPGGLFANHPGWSSLTAATSPTDSADPTDSQRSLRGGDADPAAFGAVFAQARTLTLSAFATLDTARPPAAEPTVPESTKSPVQPRGHDETKPPPRELDEERATVPPSIGASERGDAPENDPSRDCLVSPATSASENSTAASQRSVQSKSETPSDSAAVRDPLASSPNNPVPPRAPTDPLRLIPASGPRVEADAAPPSEVAAASRSGGDSVKPTPARPGGAETVTSGSVPAGATPSSTPTALAAATGLIAPQVVAAGAKPAASTGNLPGVTGVGGARASGIGAGTIQSGATLRLRFQSPAAGLNAADEEKLASQIGRGLSAALKQKGGSVTLRLTPHALGALRVQIMIDGKEVVARLEATSPATREMLSQNLDVLKQALESRGLKAEQIQIAPLEPRVAGAEPEPNDQGSRDGTDSRREGGGDLAQQNSHQSGQHGFKRSAHHNSSGTMPAQLAMLDLATASDQRLLLGHPGREPQIEGLIMLSLDATA